MYIPALKMLAGYPISADVLNCRSGPDTSSDIVTQYTQGTTVEIQCQTTGTEVNGYNIWDKTQDDCYVSDYYVETGATWVTDRCGGDSGGSGYPISADTLNCRDGPGTGYAVVTQYTEGDTVEIVCQSSGTAVNGYDVWDKTQDGCYVSDYYVETGATWIADQCEGGGGGGGDGGDGGNLPGLDSTQSSNAWEILGQAEAEGVGRQGCLAAFATALVESNIYIYANSGVPESYNYPYDRVGSDHDSVGIFQQRAMYYPDIEKSMDPAGSASQFFAKMVTVDGWETMEVGELCQTVQVSAYPDRYAERVAEAEDICDAGGF
ncbi:hypothetical protein BJX61DRAFT_542916 [Aspergillus egyptiacus]|nr:hypothetical protein BJX61DRAFT_542916 [Aspergillus egyptiacus]